FRSLTVNIIHVKLGYHVHHASHLPVSQNCSRIPVKDRNLVKRKLLDIFCEFSFFHLHQLLELFCVHNRRGKKSSRQINDPKCKDQKGKSFQYLILPDLSSSRSLLYQI